MSNKLDELLNNSDELQGLLEAHLQKPEKVQIFKDAYTKFNINNQFKFAFSWSWWAFFGGAVYFLYRKMYSMALVIAAAQIATAFLVSSNGLKFAFLVMCGLFAKYCYIAKFRKDLLLAKYGESSLSKVKETLAALGGYHTWAIWVYFALTLSWVVFLLMAFLMASTMFSH
ncbi:DUF2628 domain-containing protein [Serratia microhaemolytica]|uniref:DUF2628 domain-containing protein n=1 Tax=Serratia microhaemolytica TaxID=2675110 RepID=UPI0013923038|nr:DUF2628 domain-containing protein [Serratia microhaemolytica]